MSNANLKSTGAISPGIIGYFVSLLIDLILVVVFSLLGAQAHYGGFDSKLIFEIAWPFGLGLLLAHLSLRFWKVQFWRVWPHAFLLVAITISAAMLIRTLNAASVEAAFVLVSIAVLTLFLVGWRLAFTLYLKLK